MARRDRLQSRLSLIAPLSLVALLPLAVPLVVNAASAAGASAAAAAVPAKPAASPTGSVKTGTLASVDGQPITEAEVLASSPEFQSLDQEYRKRRYELLSRHLREFTQERVLAAEASARGITKEQLLAEAPKPAPVTDEEVAALYEQNKAKIPQAKEAVLPRIRAYLEQQRRTDARNQLFAQLEAKHGVRYLLEAPRLEIATTGFPVKGPASAPVTVVEFSDFQCPYCQGIRSTLDQLFTRYGDKVRLVFRQFPLPQHPNAGKAAEAALCAADQGKFWPMHDAMFAEQGKLDVASLKAKAAALGLDGPSFDSCLDSGKKAPLVHDDFKAGQEAGVNGTPAIFINGRAVDLTGNAPALDKLAQVIDEELKRQGTSR